MIEIIILTLWFLGIVLTKIHIDDAMYVTDKYDAILHWVVSILWPFYSILLLYFIIYESSLSMFYNIKRKIRNFVKKFHKWMVINAT